MEGTKDNTRPEDARPWNERLTMRYRGDLGRHLLRREGRCVNGRRNEQREWRKRERVCLSVCLCVERVDILGGCGAKSWECESEMAGVPRGADSVPKLRKMGDRAQRTGWPLKHMRRRKGIDMLSESPSSPSLPSSLPHQVPLISAPRIHPHTRLL